MSKTDSSRDPDLHLVLACRKFIELENARQQLFSGSGDADDDAIDILSGRLKLLAQTITGIPAETVEGLRYKARALIAITDGDFLLPSPEDDLVETPIMRSIIRDLLGGRQVLEGRDG